MLQPRIALTTTPMALVPPINLQPWSSMIFRKSLLLLVLAASATPLACREVAEEEPRTERLAQAFTAGVELIAISNCTLKNGRLINCTIPNQVLSAQQSEAAVPVRTVLKTTKSGNCSTAYPLEVTLEQPGEPSVNFDYLSASSVAVRRRDGLPIPFLTMKDSSPWTHVAAFDPSCRVSANIVWNEPDVDSAAEAQAILDRLSSDLANKTRIRDHYADLLSYQKAFDFLSRVVDYFNLELTSEMMQKLRAGAQAARPVLVRMVSADACSGTMGDADLNAIISLYESLAVLGSPAAWDSADGGAKTLAGTLDTEAPKVLEIARRLSQAHQSDAGTGYEADYERAALDVAKADAKLILARAQLANWLAH